MNSWKILMKIWKDDNDRLKMALASYYKGPNAMMRSNGEMDESTHYYVHTILKYYEDIKALK